MRGNLVLRVIYIGMLLAIYSTSAAEDASDTFDQVNIIITTPGYGIVNLVTSYQPYPQVEVFARVDNVFDKEYFTFRLLGEEPSNALGLEGFKDPRFLGSGPEHGAWASMRVNFANEDGA